MHFSYRYLIFFGIFLAETVFANRADSAHILFSNLESAGTGRCGGPVDKEPDYPKALRLAIERCFIYPPYLQEGAKCELRVSQTRQGRVTGIRVADCVGHPKFGEFAERAVLKVSPLPTPAGETSFLPVFGIIFSPDTNKFRQSPLAVPAPVYDIEMSSSVQHPFTMSVPAAAYIGDVVRAVERKLSYGPTREDRECRVRIVQNVAGQVQKVEILKCPSSELGSSVEAAVKKASPLPLPSDPALFRLSLEIPLTILARLGKQADAEPARYNPKARRFWVGTNPPAEIKACVSRILEKIERIGALECPVEAQGRIYDAAIVEFHVNSAGSLDAANIVNSSGHDLLDMAALRSVRAAAPFAEFTPEIRQQTDILVIVRHVAFEKGPASGESAR